MAITAGRKLAPFWYTPGSEREEEHPTQFKLRGLTGIEEIDVYSDARQEGDDVFISPRGMKQSLMYGLLSWQGVFDEDGNELRFIPRDRSGAIDRLPPDLIGELSSVIAITSRLSEDDLKNLQSQSKSTAPKTTSTARAAAGGGTAAKKTRRRSRNG